jgi:lipoprotein-releasing system permease protein
LYLSFAWRYFKAKKTTNAINIIAWVTTAVITFATCCQLLVLSVYNGFEALVKSLYTDFYSDCVIKPSVGKTCILTPELIAKIKSENTVAIICLEAEEKALLKNGDKQTVVTLKAVDKNYSSINGIVNKINTGKFDLGTADEPHLLVGYGIQNAAEITVSDALPSSIVTIILPKKTLNNNIDDAMSEGNCLATGVFAIQQELDEKYAITNLDFMKAQLGFGADEYSAAEIKFKANTNVEKAKEDLQKLLGKNFEVQTRFEQNSNLYNTLKMEKWAIYAVLTLILIIAAFNMVSALSMLVLEKTKDIAILKSMGTTSAGIQKIFLAEGVLLGLIGAGTGIILALAICLLQLKFKFIKITGDTFMIDYFPVKLIAKDFILVAITAVLITFLASWYPAKKAAGNEILLK